MAYASEPVRIGTVFSGAFTFIGVEWRTLALLAALPSAPGAVYAVYTASSPGLASIQEEILAISQYVLALSLLILLLSHFAYASALAFSVDRLAGRETGVGPAFSRGLRLFLPLLAVRALVYLATWFGLIFFFVPGIILYTMFFVADAACTDERMGITAALGRSRALTKGSRWRIFVLLLLLTLGLWAISAVQLALPFLPFGQMLNGIFTFASSMFFYILIPALTAVLFRELRTLKEGDVADDVAAVF